MISQAIRPLTRPAYAVLTLTAAVTAATITGAWTALVVSALAPDLALLAGAARGLAPGQLHPRAVPAYNALHSLPGPLVLVALGALVSPALAVAGLGWAAHIAVDRAVGYGLRTPAGFQHAA